MAEYLQRLGYFFATTNSTESAKFWITDKGERYSLCHADCQSLHPELTIAYPLTGQNSIVGTVMN
jgi:hypothetical protein